jgi:hypothetical protein
VSRRINFKGGWWADVRTAWPYGADTKIAGVWAFVDNDEKFQAACLVTLAESVTNAHLPDIEGNALPYATDMWSVVNGKIARHLLKVTREGWAKWQEDIDPKDTSATSDASPQE